MDGYLVVAQDWQGTHELEIDIPMPIQRVVANENVQDLIGKVALERGPIVYALEGIDHKCDVFDVVLDNETTLQADPHPELLGGITAIVGVAKDKSDKPQKIMAIPYYAGAIAGLTR